MALMTPSVSAITAVGMTPADADRPAADAMTDAIVEVASRSGTKSGPVSGHAARSAASGA